MSTPRSARHWFTHAYKSPLVIAIGIAALGGVWVAARLHGHTEVQVTTAAVTTGPIVRSILAAGTLQSITTVAVGSQVSGTIQEIDADFNSIVKKGQIIAKLDPASFQAQLDQAKANANQARANASEAQSNVALAGIQLLDAHQKWDRARELAAQQIETASDLDAAMIALDAAQAALASQRATVAQAQAAVEEADAEVDQSTIALDRCIITSPINGIVIERNVDVGQTVAASVSTPTLFIIAADLRKMQVEVDIDEADIAGIGPGQPVTFEVESYPDQVFTGTVTQVRLQPVAVQTITATAASGSIAAAATTAVPSVIAYATIINVDNPQEILRPGMTATVALDGTRRDGAVRIPNNALSFRPPVNVLAELGQKTEYSTSSSGAAEDGRPRVVWSYDGKRFIPVEVHTGLADAQWTELVGGGLTSGANLVTNASLIRLNY